MESFGRFKLYLFLVLIWAGIYLPHLGVLEINFDEHKRAIPAITMIESGDWIVPKLAGREYYNKPPLINWLIAASFKITGERNELAARLPSVLFILFFTSVLFWTDFKRIGFDGRFIAALIFLTCGAVVQKGRQCEIDAAYTCLTGLSIFLWMYLWNDRNSWLRWLLPSIVLGCGLLLKGPMILLFYYAFVISVLIHARRTKELLSFQHICAILIFIGMFMAWSIPCSRMRSDQIEMAATWKQQMLLRFKDNSNILVWMGRAAGSVLAFVPWIVLVPFMWNKKWLDSFDESDRQFFKSCRTGLIVAFLLVALMPGTRSRYSMPSFALASILLGWLISVQRYISFEKIWSKAICLLSALLGIFSVMYFTLALNPGILKSIPGIPEDLPGKFDVFAGSAMIPAAFAAAISVGLCAYFILNFRKISGALKLTAMSALLIMATAICNSFFFIPVLNQYADFRPAGLTLKNAIPENEDLHAYKIECEHFMFYVPQHINFLYKDIDVIGGRVKYVLFKNEHYEEFIKYPNVQKRDPEVLISINSDDKDYKLVHYRN